MKKINLLALTAIVGLTLVGCTATPAQKGAGYGAAVGGIAGQLIGGDTESTLLGAGAGALGGAILNDHIDKQKRNSYEQGYYSGQARNQSYESKPQPYYNTSPR